MLDDAAWCLDCGNALKLGDVSTFCSVKCETSYNRLKAPQHPQEVLYRYSHSHKERLFKQRDAKVDNHQNKPRRSLPNVFSPHPSISATILNESSLKLEPLLGNQSWISVWASDVHKHGESSRTAVHFQSDFASGSDVLLPSVNPLNADETSDGSQVPTDEAEAHTSVHNSRTRPHIRSRYSCPADFESSRLAPLPIFTRPKLLAQTQLPVLPIIDLTSMHVPHLSRAGDDRLASQITPQYQRRASLSHHMQRLDDSENSSATHIDDDACPASTDHASGAITSSSGAVLGLLKSYLNLTSSVSAAETTSSKAKVRLTASSQAGPKSPTQCAPMRPRAHTTSYAPAVRQAPKFFIPDDSASPSITVPVETPRDSISELCLDMKKTPTAHTGHLKRAFEGAISTEYLAKALGDCNLDAVETSRIKANELSFLPSAFNSDRSHLKDEPLHLEAHHKQQWSPSVSPVAIAAVPEFRVTRGRPLARDFATVGPTICSRRRRSRSSRYR